MFKKIGGEKYATEIANQIKKLIFDGTYGPSDRLPSEGEMAELFGVSKSTVRQAIRVLESSGIIFTKQGADGGIFVQEADTGAVSTYLSDMLKLKRVAQSDLTVARQMFEPYVAFFCTTHWQGNDLEPLEENIRSSRIAIQEGRLADVRLLSLTFHRLVCQLTGNPVITFTLNAVIDVLEENVFKIVLPDDFIKGEVDYHEELLDLMRQRKPEEARELMYRHVCEVHRKLAECSEPSATTAAAPSTG